MMSRRAVFAFSIVSLVLTLSTLPASPALADDAKDAEDLAVRYVTALESGRFTEAAGLAVGAARSWVEYASATGEKHPGGPTIISCESAPFADYQLVKVVFKDADGKFGVRYVKAREAADGTWSVVDDGRRGRAWASDSFLPGVMFKEPFEVDGVRVTVTALLELPAEVKFDILIENTLDREISIYPQLEAYYTVETAKIGKTYYYPIAVNSDVDGPVAAKSSKRGFLIFPKFVKDFAADPTLEGLKWVLYIPYGVSKQFVISR